MQTLWTLWVNSGPAKRAFLLTVAMRLLYSGLAAAMVPFLQLDPRLIRLNYFTEHLMQPSQGLSYFLLGVWQRFDTLWYIHIAQSGYDRPEGVVFYPLYPLLIKFLSIVTRDPLVAALLISAASTFFLFWGLQELLALDLDDSEVRRALLACALWPSGFMFLAGYADSLVAALIVWSVYFARTGQWWLAGATGYFAGLAKAVGLLAAVPLAVIALRSFSIRVLPAALCLFGPATYFSYLVKFGHPLPSEIYPKIWQTSAAWPWETLIQHFNFFIYGSNNFRLNFAIFILAFLLAMWRNVRREYLAYAAGALLLMLAKNSAMVQSQWCRYSLVVFPAFANLGRSHMDDDLYTVVLAGLASINIALLFLYLDWNLVV